MLKRIAAAAALAAGILSVAAPAATADCIKIRQHVTCTATTTTPIEPVHKKWSSTATTTSTTTTLGNINNKPQADTTTSDPVTVNRNPAGKLPPGQNS
jgi:hypothetical protein